MQIYRYIIQYKDSSCLYLSELGPEKKSKDFLAQLRDEGFQFSKEEQLGESMLQIMVKDQPQRSAVGCGIAKDPISEKRYKVE